MTEYVSLNKKDRFRVMAVTVLVGVLLASACEMLFGIAFEKTISLYILYQLADMKCAMVRVEKDKYERGIVWWPWGK